MSRPRVEIPDEDGALLAELAKLKEQYRAELPGKLAALDAAVRSVLGPGPAPADLRQAHQLAHNLRGTARSYGLDALSQVAAAIDDELEALAVEPAEERASRQARLLEGLAQLARLAAG